jgi:Protein of Unknown function (DUF2784)
LSPTIDGVGLRLLVQVILLTHFAFLAYVVFGGFLAWRWPRTIWGHLVAAAWGLFIVLYPVTCPLTWAEDQARRHAGEPGLTRGFIDRYVTGVLYPSRFVVPVRFLVAGVVLVSWAGWWYRRRRRASRT